MGHITSLHELVRGAMPDLANRRTMPQGYDRAASRRAERMVPELRGHLPDILAGYPDVLMPHPVHRRWQELLAEAAQERLLKDMVARLVALLASEPRPDQQTACALGTVNDQVAGSYRLQQRLDGMAAEMEEVHKLAQRCGFAEELDLANADQALQALRRQTRALQLRLESYRTALEQDLPGD